MTWYVMMLFAAFLVFLLIVISIIRLIAFGLTYFKMLPGIVKFPNLYEDVDFIFYFIPLV